MKSSLFFLLAVLFASLLLTGLGNLGTMLVTKVMLPMLRLMPKIPQFVVNLYSAIILGIIFLLGIIGISPFVGMSKKDATWRTPEPHRHRPD